MINDPFKWLLNVLFEYFVNLLYYIISKFQIMDILANILTYKKCFFNALDDIIAFYNKYLSNFILPHIPTETITITTEQKHMRRKSSLIWKYIEYAHRELDLCKDAIIHILLSVETWYFICVFIFFSISIFIYKKGYVKYNNNLRYLDPFKISLNFTIFILLLVTVMYTIDIFNSSFIYMLENQQLLRPRKHWFVYHEFINNLPLLYLKWFICFSALLITIAANKLLRENFSLPFGFLYLFLFYVGSLLIILSVNDFLLFYVFLEIISLLSYLLLALYKDNTSPLLAIEAAIKYLIMGSFTIAFFLLGASFLYFYLGTLNFTQIYYLLQYTMTGDVQFFSFMFSISILLVCLILFFKLAVAPFHTWSIDVYTASSFFVFCIFMILPKIALAYVLLNFINLFSPYYSIFSTVFYCLGIVSIVLGILGGLFQTTFQRLFAYSAVVNIGFYFIALSLNIYFTNVLSLLFIVIYTITNLGFFLYIFPFLIANHATILVNTFFKKYAFANWLLYIFALVALFSLAGLPPLLGFWGKIFIIFAFVQQKLYLTSLFLLIATSILTFFYINLIREIAFSETNFWSFPPVIPTLTAHAFILLFFVNTISFCCFITM